MISFAVCDDNRQFVLQMASQLTSLAKAHGLSCTTELYLNGRDLVDAIKSDSFFDIIFLDIEMDGFDGLRTAREIRKLDKTVIIVYVSSHSKYAIEAYEHRPFRFLTKPLDKILLEKCFLAATEEIIDQNVYYDYMSNKQAFRVPLKDILYFESSQRDVMIVVDNERHRYRDKLSSIEKKLSSTRNDFWRIHQSFLINRHHIYRISYSEVEMSNGTVLPISQSRRKGICKQYLAVIGKNTHI
jgi:DNA-binding LytR/AlgR family response regulator